MENIVWLDLDTPVKLFIDLQKISWQYKNRDYRFPWDDVIGSKVGLSLTYFMIMALNRKKNQFKIYRFRHTASSLAHSTVEKINNLAIKFQRNYAVFANPISGNGKSIKIYNEYISDLLDYSNSRHTLFEINNSSYFTTLDPQDLLEFTDIVCLGGDGTVHQLLSVLYKPENLIPKFNFCVVPTGSQNALSCELYGKSINSSLLSMVKGTARLCDLMKITLEDKELIATTAVSWGLVSEITDEAQQYRLFGPLRYGLIGFLKVFQTLKEYTCEISSGNEKELGTYVTVLIGNHPAPDTNGDAIVFPKGNISDGYIDIVTMDHASKWKTIKMFNKMRNKGQHIKCKKVHCKKAKSVSVSAKNHFVFNVDGEIYYSANINVQILEKSISYLIIE